MPRRVRAPRVYVREAGVSDCPMFRHQWSTWFLEADHHWSWRECWVCHVVEAQEAASGSRAPVKGP
jgi:hypothetical protein